MHSKRVFGCLDTYKTTNFGFTPSQQEKKKFKPYASSLKKSLSTQSRSNS